MAEDVNFLLDQTRNTRTFQFLRESYRPRRIEGQEQQSVNELGSLSSRVELFQGVRQQADEDLRNLTDLKNQEAKQNIAKAEQS